jgi:hypothetical protein
VSPDAVYPSAALDLVLYLTVAGAFALLVTAHVVLAASLFLRAPRWRGFAALLVPPLAPYWGMEERMRFRSGLWLAALVLYVLSQLAARL